MGARTLKVIVFPGGFNLPIWSGLAAGYFADEGLELDLHLTTSSKEQLAGMIHGEFDIGMTGIDNVIAYMEGQGEAEIHKTPDLFTFMGGDDAFLSLVTIGEVTSFDDLRGRTLSVDAMTTGFAFVLREMIEKSGLEDGAVTFESVGGVMQRWEALKAGEQAGTLLLTPFDVIGEAIGLNVLARGRDHLPAYQGVVGAASRTWAAENGDALVGYIRAYRRALAWLFDTSNRAAAEAILVERVPNMSPEVAAAACDIFLDPNAGFEPAAAIDWAGINVVLKLRSKYGEPRKSLTDAHKYVDLTWYEKAAP
ncbi:MAG TPA: ABC transporter substrate-binding protein [Alphaproteobacteria bacterium]|nr:ABC transporter substrate-binding protein [Alphaproteobacteria bacterium]